MKIRLFLVLLAASAACLLSETSIAQSKFTKIPLSPDTSIKVIEDFSHRLNPVSAIRCIHARQNASYSAQLGPYSWDWSSNLSCVTNFHAVPEIDVAQLTDISELTGDFYLSTTDGDCSRVTAKIKFKATIPGMSNRDIPWQTQTLTPVGSGAYRSCRFSYNIPMNVVNDLIDNHPSYLSGARTRGGADGEKTHYLAVVLSAQDDACIERSQRSWEQKFYVEFTEEAAEPSFNWALRAWNSDF